MTLLTPARTISALAFTAFGFMLGAAMTSVGATPSRPARARRRQGLRDAHLHRARRQAAEPAGALPRSHDPHLQQARHEERRLLGAAGRARPRTTPSSTSFRTTAARRRRRTGPTSRRIPNGRRCRPNRRSTAGSSARSCRCSWTPRITRRSNRIGIRDQESGIRDQNHAHHHRDVDYRRRSVDDVDR